MRLVDHERGSSGDASIVTSGRGRACRRPCCNDPRSTIRTRLARGRGTGQQPLAAPQGRYGQTAAAGAGQQGALHDAVVLPARRAGSRPGADQVADDVDVGRMPADQGEAILGAVQIAPEPASSSRCTAARPRPAGWPTPTCRNGRWPPWRLGNPRVAVQPEIVVGGEIDQPCGRSAWFRPGDAVMWTEKRVRRSSFSAARCVCEQVPRALIGQPSGGSLVRCRRGSPAPGPASARRCRQPCQKLGLHLIRQPEQPRSRLMPDDRDGALRWNGRYLAAMPRHRVTAAARPGSRYLVRTCRVIDRSTSRAAMASSVVPPARARTAAIARPAEPPGRSAVRPPSG